MSRELNGRTSLYGSGNYSILDFISGPGINSNQTGGQAGLNRRFDPRSGGGVSASSAPSLWIFRSGPRRISSSAGASGFYNRQIEPRSLTFDGSIGPQEVSRYHIIVGSGPTQSILFVPESLNISANAGLVYTKKYTTAHIATIACESDSGSGVQEGAIGDTGSAQLQHTYGRNCSGIIDWRPTYCRDGTGRPRTPGLRRLSTGAGRLTNAFSQSLLDPLRAYTAINQSTEPSHLASAWSAINGFSQSIAARITFSPRLVRLNQF